MPRKAKQGRRSDTRTSFVLPAELRRGLLAWAAEQEKAAGLPPGGVGLGGAVRAAVAAFVTSDDPEKAGFGAGHAQGLKAAYGEALGRLGGALVGLGKEGDDA